MKHEGSGLARGKKVSPLANEVIDFIFQTGLTYGGEGMERLTGIRKTMAVSSNFVKNSPTDHFVSYHVFIL